VVQLIRLVVASCVTLSVVSASYSALKPDRLEAQARVVAARADCRAVDEAIVAYVTLHDRDPKTVRDLAGLVKGDISAYRIVGGTAAGPGC
jgi:hypothetical protein